MSRVLARLRYAKLVSQLQKLEYLDSLTTAVLSGTSKRERHEGLLFLRLAAAEMVQIYTSCSKEAARLGELFEAHREEFNQSMNFTFGEIEIRREARDELHAKFFAHNGLEKFVRRSIERAPQLCQAEITFLREQVRSFEVGSATTGDMSEDTKCMIYGVGTAALFFINPVASIAIACNAVARCF